MLSGTASYGNDYVLLGSFNSGRILIQPGQSSATVTLLSFDRDGPLLKTATMTIIGGQRYRVGSPSKATVKIQNVR